MLYNIFIAELCKRKKRKTNDMFVVRAILNFRESNAVSFCVHSEKVRNRYAGVCVRVTHVENINFFLFSVRWKSIFYGCDCAVNVSWC